MIILDPNNTRRHNAETIYPGLVGGCLGLQLVVFMIVMRLTKRGRALLRRDEKEKTKDFWDLHLAGDESVAHDMYHPHSPKQRKGSDQSISVSMETYNPKAPLLNISL